MNFHDEVKKRMAELERINTGPHALEHIVGVCQGLRESLQIFERVLASQTTTLETMASETDGTGGEV